jgi:predicted nucleotidyltransferase component of viral defense system
MIEYNKAQLSRVAQENGFMRDTFEKVLRLKEVLKFINLNDYLSQHLVLKGGTAINMTIFDLPRLSVDIDLDYIPNDTLEKMQDARNNITGIVKEYMQGEGYSLLPSSRYSFSLDALYFQYLNGGGNKDILKIEINYSLRAHIFEPVERVVLGSIFEEQLKVLVLNPMEIFAAKTNALMSRAAARDLYDFNNMEYYGLFDESDKVVFRKCIIFYNTISQKTINMEFDTSAIDQLTINKIKRD